MTRSTDQLRTRFPHLCWVWDGLDDLCKEDGSLNKQIDEMRKKLVERLGSHEPPT